MNLDSKTLSDVALPWLQAVSWVVAAVGGVIAAYRAVHEMKVANVERANARADSERELLWRMAEKAQSQLSLLFHDELAALALELVDVDGLPFRLPGATASTPAPTPVSHSALRHALRVTNLHFTALELDIKRCFDRLLAHLGTMDHMIAIGLIQDQHVVPALEYHGRGFAAFQTELALYASTFGYEDALRMIERLPEWRSRNR